MNKCIRNFNFLSRDIGTYKKINLEILISDIFYHSNCTQQISMRISTSYNLYIQGSKLFEQSCTLVGALNSIRATSIIRAKSQKSQKIVRKSQKIINKSLKFIQNTSKMDARRLPKRIFGDLGSQNRKKWSPNRLDQCPSRLWDNFGLHFGFILDLFGLFAFTQ